MTRVRAGIKEVASAAGVSVTTVSHALSGKGRVDPATRLRVAQVAAELNYQPLRHARALSSGKNMSIGLLSAFTAEDEQWADGRMDWYMRTALATARAAIALGYTLILVPPLEHEVLPDAVSTVDGVVLVDSGPRGLRQLGIPTVTIGGDPAARSPASVTVDVVAGIDLVLTHFMEKGARRPALLTDGTKRWQTSASEAAFEAWCSRHGVEGLAAVAGQDGWASAVADCRRLLTDHPEVDAVYATLDTIFVALQRAATDLAIPPERQPQYATTDGLPARRSTVPLVAVNVRREELAARAVQLLVGQLETGKRARHELFQPSLTYITPA